MVALIPGHTTDPTGRMRTTTFSSGEVTGVVIPAAITFTETVLRMAPDLMDRFMEGQVQAFLTAAAEGMANAINER